MTKQTEKAAMPLNTSRSVHFQVYKDGQSQYRFRLVAGNGEIIATGEAYKRQKDCLAVISLVKLCANAEVKIISSSGKASVGEVEG
jgi:uncharacterized protein